MGVLARRLDRDTDFRSRVHPHAGTAKEHRSGSQDRLSGPARNSGLDLCGFLRERSGAHANGLSRRFLWFFSSSLSPSPVSKVGGSAIVLAPLIISIALIAAFFFYESRIPGDRASFPPKTWKYTNFAVLFGVALSCYLWFAGSLQFNTYSSQFGRFAAMFYLIITMWQDVFLWSAVNSAVQYVYHFDTRNVS